MTPDLASRIHDLLSKHEPEILAEWVRQQQQSLTRRRDLIADRDLERESREFLGLFRAAAQRGNLQNVRAGPEWAPVREMLADLSRSRGTQGFSPSETAGFVFSLKPPLFTRLRAEMAQDADCLFGALDLAGGALDTLGLFTTEIHQQSREEVIRRQQEDMLELSTPVVKLWDGILAVPMIGTLDSARTQVVMETLLQRIVDTGSEVAIIDITGVPTVDTLVAQHLLKTVTAARLMGADCIISGIRPQIAQTIVHLGVELGDVVTKGNLADAFRYALQRQGVALGARPARA